MTLHIKIDDCLIEDEIRRIAAENRITLKSTVLRMLQASIGETLPDIPYHSTPIYQSGSWYIGDPNFRDVTVKNVTGVIAGLVGSFVELYGNIPNTVFIPKGETHANVVYQAIKNYGLGLELGSTNLDMGLIAVGYPARQ